MKQAVKIDGDLVERLDAACGQFSISTRQSLTNTIVRKGLDYLLRYGYDALLKLPNREIGCTEDMSDSGEKG